MQCELAQQVVDEITLRVVGSPDAEQPRLIAQGALAAARRMASERDPDIQDVSAIRDWLIIGVMERLAQIEAGGDGIGRC